MNSLYIDKMLVFSNKSLTSAIRNALLFDNHEYEAVSISHRYSLSILPLFLFLFWALSA
jgi:hypothetical protein